jgi:membrane protease YdiL (CAAX protease family)
VFVLAVILLANFLHVRNRKTEKFVFDALLFLTSAAILFLGTMLVLIPPDLFKQAAPNMTISALDTRPFGMVLMITSGWAMVMSIEKIRMILARIMPLNPDSPVHTLALVLSVYLIGYMALILSQGDLTEIAESASPASLTLLFLSEFLFVVIALFGIGLIIRRRGRELMQRLGLKRPKPLQLLVGVGLIALLVVLQMCGAVIWSLLNPEQSQAMEDVNSALLLEFDTVWEWFLLALATGVGEEILFRGALQPVLGLGFTSVLFALVHIQYGFTPVTLFIVLIALVLGIVRKYYSTTITIFIHVGYNFSLGLLALLLSYLQQFAP